MSKLNILVDYTDISALRCHIRSAHEGVSYKCDICQYKAKQKATLAQHIKIVHFKERPYHCKICDFQASQKVILSRHVKSIHQKPENIHCTNCNKSIKETSIHRHMKRFHSGEQPQYNCKVCTYQTVYSSNLIKHVQVLHQTR